MPRPTRPGLRSVPKPPEPGLLRIVHVPLDDVGRAGASAAIEAVLDDEFDIVGVTLDPAGNGWHYHFMLFPEVEDDDDDDDDDDE